MILLISATELKSFQAKQAVDARIKLLKYYNNKVI